jgi:O-antigen ligase
VNLPNAYVSVTASLARKIKLIERLANLIDKFSFILIIIVILWAPIPLGSDRPWAIGLLSILVAILTVSAWSSSILLGRSFRVLNKSIIGIFSLVLYACLIFGQYLNGYQANTNSLQTYDPYATKIQLILTITSIGFFASILLVAQTKDRLKFLLWSIVVSGLMQAIFAIYMLSIQSHYEILFFKVNHSANAKGSFGYHNSFAGYMEICLSTGLGLLLASFSDKNILVDNWKSKITAILSFLLSSKMLLRLLLILMVIALVLTRSRMGNAGFMTALLLVLIVALFVMKDLRKILTWLVISVVLIDTLVIGQWVGLHKVIERIENTSLTVSGKGKSESVEQRVEPAFGAIVMVKDRVWTGFGAGSFYTAFVPYKPSNLHGYYDHAHNDYIEILADAGVVGMFFLGLFACSTIYCAVKLMRSDKNFQRGIGFGTLLAIVSIAIHGTVDFNLHIPANSITLIALCAVCWTVRFNTLRRESMVTK